MTAKVTLPRNGVRGKRGGGREAEGRRTELLLSVVVRGNEPSLWD